MIRLNRFSDHIKSTKCQHCSQTDLSQNQFDVNYLFDLIKTLIKVNVNIKSVIMFTTEVAYQ